MSRRASRARIANRDALLLHPALFTHTRPTARRVPNRRSPIGRRDRVAHGDARDATTDLANGDRRGRRDASADRDGVATRRRDAARARRAARVDAIGATARLRHRDDARVGLDADAGARAEDAGEGRRETGTRDETRGDGDGDADADGDAPGARERLTIDELKEEIVEEEVEELTVLGRVTEGVRAASENPGLRNLGALGFFFLASTFAYSCYKVFRKATSGRMRRKRTVNKNVEVVERLKNFFPNERSSVNKGVVRGLALKTGYSSAEIFRKYLRYKLTEEAFTLDFVADVLALKGACGLDSEEMKEILLETGERMFKKYGTLMTNLAGLTQSGMERKIDGAGKFAKLMYLADLDEFIDKAHGAEVQLKLKETFGATDDDYNKLRITALGSDEVDVSSLNSMIGSVDSASSEQPSENAEGEP